MKKFLFSLMLFAVVLTANAQQYGYHAAVAKGDSAKVGLSWLFQTPPCDTCYYQAAQMVFQPKTGKFNMPTSPVMHAELATMLTNKMNATKAVLNQKPDDIKVVEVVGTLPNSGNLDYKNYFAKESGGSQITSFVDSAGVRHAIRGGGVQAISAGARMTAYNDGMGNYVLDAIDGQFLSFNSTTKTLSLQRSPSVVLPFASQVNLDSIKAKIAEDSLIAANNINYVQSKLDSLSSPKSELATIYTPNVADVGITTSTPAGTTTEGQTNYLLVSGAIGDTFFTINNSLNLSFFNTSFTGVVNRNEGERYDSYFVDRVENGKVILHYPLTRSYTSDTLRVSQDVSNGQHLSPYGYRALADELFDTKKYTTERQEYITKFTPEDGVTTAIPFTLYGGASTGGWVQGAVGVIANSNGLVSSNISYAVSDSRSYAFQQGGAAGKGARYDIFVGGYKSYLTAKVGVLRYPSLPISKAIVRIVNLDNNTTIFTETISGALREINVPLESINNISLQIEAADANPLDFRLSGLAIHTRKNDTETTVFEGKKKVLLYGDSWTVFWDSTLQKRLDYRIKQIDATASVVTKGRGGMTSKWGNYWVNDVVFPYNPDFVLTNFRINDLNSLGSSSTTWNFSSSGANNSGSDVFGAISTESAWRDSLNSLNNKILAKGIDVISMKSHYTASIAQSQTQLAVVARQYGAGSQYYSAGSYSTTNLSKSTTLITGTATADTLSATAMTATRLSGAASAVGAASLTFFAKDPNAAAAKSFSFRPLSSRTGGIALSIEDVSGNFIAGQLWTGGYTATTFNATYPWTGGGFATNGLRLEQTGSVGYLKTEVAQSWLEIGTGYGSTRFRTPVMFPSYTTAQRDALTSLANGMQIYNSDTGKMQARAAGAWVDLH